MVNPTDGPSPQRPARPSKADGSGDSSAVHAVVTKSGGLTFVSNDGDSDCEGNG